MDGIGAAAGLGAQLAVTVQALRDSAQAGQTAVQLVEGASAAQGGNPAPAQVNAGLAGEPGDPNAPRGSYLDITA